MELQSSRRGRAVRPGPAHSPQLGPLARPPPSDAGDGAGAEGAPDTVVSVSPRAPGRRRRVSDLRLCGGVHDFFAPSQPRHLHPEPTLRRQKRFKPAGKAAMIRAQKVPPLRDGHDGKPSLCPVIGCPPRLSAQAFPGNVVPSPLQAAGWRFAVLTKLSTNRFLAISRILVFPQFAAPRNSRYFSIVFLLF